MRIGATLAGIVGGTKLQTARDLGIEVSPEGSITDEVIELHVAVLHRTQVSPPMVELGHSAICSQSAPLPLLSLKADTR
jgi:hypothetical protein